MPYCPRCGVEVDANVDSCPLCATAIPRFDDARTVEHRYPDLPIADKPHMSEAMRRRLIWEVASLFFIVGIIVVIGSDLRADGKIDWSLYPTASIILCWVFMTLLMFLRRHVWASALGIILSSIGFLAVVDDIDGKIQWFVNLGLPISAVFLIISGAVAFGVAKIKDKGFNVIAFVLLGAAIFCACVDMLVSVFHTGEVLLTWSLVVLLSVVPFSIILLFLHYRLRERFDMKRIFRI